MKEFKRRINDWNRTENAGEQCPVVRATMLQKLEGESNGSKWKVTETRRE
jgi:hypothetical protein